MKFTTRAVADRDREWVLEIVRSWGGDHVVSCGRVLAPADLPGILAETPTGRRIGLATYEIVDDQCELVTLDALEPFSGIGTTLTESVRQAAGSAGCSRLWLITTNDNLDAIRFYQRRGFTIADIHVNAMARSRELKPTIPAMGQFGIPLRDEIVFEQFLPFGSNRKRS